MSTATGSKPYTLPPLSWDPVLNGDTYCSSACGYGCKKAAFDLATERGDALAKELGEGWTPNVWENFGWHYSAGKGVCQIHPNIRDGVPQSYTAFFNTKICQFLGKGNTAGAALGDAITQFSDATNESNKQLEHLFDL